MKVLEEYSRFLDWQQHEVVHGQSRQRRECVRAHFDAVRQEPAGGIERGIGVRLRTQAPAQRIGFQPRAGARFARRIGAVAREHDAHVHLVGLGLQPLEEPADAVPFAGPGLAPAHPARIAVDHPLALLRRQLAPRGVRRHAALLRVLDEVVVPAAIRLSAPGPDRILVQRLRFVGHHQAVVHADHPPEAAAGLARSDRRVERKQARRRVGVVNVAIGAMEVRGVSPGSVIRDP